MTKESGLRNRRMFLRTFGTLPIVSTLLPLSAQDSPPDSPQADALMESVRLRYGSYLAEDDAPEIKRGIERMLRNAETLAKVKTTNGDAPDFLFSPNGNPNS
jgi:hypothetical protein